LIKLLVKVYWGSRGRRNSKNNTTKKMLLLAPGLPPDSGSGAHRPTSLLRYAGHTNWAINAISDPISYPDSSAGRYLASTIPKTVMIDRFEKIALTPSWKLMPKIDGGFQNVLSIVDFSIKKYKDDPPDIVMSTSPPFYFAVAAYYVAKYFNANFVFEYRDEWTQCPFDFVTSGKLDKYYEKKLLDKASAVIYTTESQRDRQFKIFRGKCKNVFVIPNGWEANDVDGTVSVNSQEKIRKEKVIISFIGQMATHSFPIEFLKTLQELLSKNELAKDKLLVRFIGRKPQEALDILKAFPFPSNIEILDQVTKPEALNCMKDSDALLIFSTPDLARYRPGKLYDYIASGTPIVIFGAKGEASELVENLGVGVHISEKDKDGFNVLLESLMSHDRVIEVNKDVVNKWLIEHSRESLALSLFSKLDKIR